MFFLNVSQYGKTKKTKTKKTKQTNKKNIGIKVYKEINHYYIWKIAEGSYLGHTILRYVVCQEKIDELSWHFCTMI